MRVVPLVVATQRAPEEATVQSLFNPLARQVSLSVCAAARRVDRIVSQSSTKTTFGDLHTEAKSRTLLVITV